MELIPLTNEATQGELQGENKFIKSSTILTEHLVNRPLDLG